GTLRQGTPVSYCTLSSVAPAEPLILAKIVGIFIQKRHPSGGGSHKLSGRLARRSRTTLYRKLQYDQNREERRYITHQRKRKCLIDMGWQDDTVAELFIYSIPRSERASFECKSCVLAKIIKQPFKERSSTVSKPFKRLHLDLIGPINPESSLKNCYILTVVNNHTGYLAGLPLVHKDDTTGLISKNYVLRWGWGLISKPYNPENNGRAKRANRTIVDSMRTTINSSGLQKRFWHEILKLCCLGLNQIPKKGFKKLPWEMLHDKSFLIGLLKAIGTPAVVLNMAKVKGLKFDSKGEEGNLIGFNVPLQSYWILTQTGRVIETKQ
ncbi:hypothetical protein VP01_5874g1, partial [Puccinia sorghi]